MSVLEKLKDLEYKILNNVDGFLDQLEIEFKRNLMEESHYQTIIDYDTFKLVNNSLVDVEVLDVAINKETKYLSMTFDSVNVEKEEILNLKLGLAA